MRPLHTATHDGRDRTQAIRWGLCCLFAEHPIRFRTTTATAMLRLSLRDRRCKLAELCRANAESLLAALEYCATQGIGCFRINSQILPIKTHPKAGFRIEDLAGAEEIVEAFQRCGQFAHKHGIRLCFHPDQFVVLNSPRTEVVRQSVAELEYQAEVANWVGADVINIHAGGGYGDKPAAMDRFAHNLGLLSDEVRQRLTIENDDTTYKPSELLPLCRAQQLPLVYDVHHHRCLPDELGVEEATAEALSTWNREPLFHISSPKHGWQGSNPKPHHDYIDLSDFPACWRDLAITVEVEAKAKELAVLRLQQSICGTSGNSVPTGVRRY